MERPQRLARKQERRSAGVYGGRQVSMSGSGDRKGDIATSDELVECKHTQVKSYRLRLDEFLNHLTHAILVNKRAVWEIEFTTPGGQDGHHLVVLDRNDYLAMRDEIQDWRDSAGIGD